MSYNGQYIKWDFKRKHYEPLLNEFNCRTFDNQINRIFFIKPILRANATTVDLAFPSFKFYKFTSPRGNVWPTITSQFKAYLLTTVLLKSK